MTFIIPEIDPFTCGYAGPSCNIARTLQDAGLVPGPSCFLCLAGPGIATAPYHKTPVLSKMVPALTAIYYPDAASKYRKMPVLLIKVARIYMGHGWSTIEFLDTGPPGAGIVYG